MIPEIVSQDGIELKLVCSLPLKANSYTLGLTQKIQDMLIRKIAILPMTEQETIKPFKIKLYDEIITLKKDNITVKDLRRAINAYCASLGYLKSLSLLNARRHDIDGIPESDVSEYDQLSAVLKIAKVMEVRRNKKLACERHERKVIADRERKRLEKENNQKPDETAGIEKDQNKSEKTYSQQAIRSAKEPLRKSEKTYVKEKPAFEVVTKTRKILTLNKT